MTKQQMFSEDFGPEVKPKFHPRERPDGFPQLANESAGDWSNKHRSAINFHNEKRQQYLGQVDSRQLTLVQQDSLSKAEDQAYTWLRSRLHLVLMQNGDQQQVWIVFPDVLLRSGTYRDRRPQRWEFGRDAINSRPESIDKAIIETQRDSIKAGVAIARKRMHGRHDGATQQANEELLKALEKEAAEAAADSRDGSDLVGFLLPFDAE